MFEFTREFIINSNVGELTNGKKFDVSGDTLMVARMVNLKKGNITRVTKHAYAAPVNDKVVVSFSGTGLVKGDVVRLAIAMTQEGRVISTFNDQYPHHLKHYYYEAEVTTANTIPWAALKASMDRETALGEDLYYNFTTSSTTFEATDCYSRFVEISLVRKPQATPVENLAAVLTGYQDYDIIAEWKRINSAVNGILTPGSEGAGTVARILKNMRLLSDAHLDPYGLQRDERPLPTGKYTQYSIEYVVERRQIGSQVMGAIDHSLSNHIFFVESAAVSDFDAALASLGLTVELTSTPDTTLPKQVIPMNTTSSKASVKSLEIDLTGGTSTGTFTLNPIVDENLTPATSDSTVATASYAKATGTVTVTAAATGSATITVAGESVEVTVI